MKAKFDCSLSYTWCISALESHIRSVYNLIAVYIVLLSILYATKKKEKRKGFGDLKEIRGREKTDDDESQKQRKKIESNFELLLISIFQKDDSDDSDIGYTIRIGFIRIVFIFFVTGLHYVRSNIRSNDLPFLLLT